MRNLILVAGLVLVVMLGIASYFLLRSDTIPNDPATKANTLTSQITIAETDAAVTVDFGACQPDSARIYGAQGSTTIQIAEKSGSDCLMDYGREVENPNWDGVLDVHCQVPVSLGKVSFNKNGVGIDLTQIDQYCST